MCTTTIYSYAFGNVIRLMLEYVENIFRLVTNILIMVAFVFVQLALRITYVSYV